MVSQEHPLPTSPEQSNQATMDRTDSRIDLNLFRVLDAIYTYVGEA